MPDTDLDREKKIRSAFIDMLANLRASVYSYERFAGSSTKKGERDAFFNTRSKDYNNAIVRADRAFKELFPNEAGAEPNISKYLAEKRVPNI